MVGAECLARSMRRPLHFARGAIGFALRSEWEWTAAAHCGFLFPHCERRVLVGSRGLLSLSLPSLKCLLNLWVLSSRVENSDLVRVGKEVREMSSRQALFLELCGILSGMSSSWLENICKTLPLCVGHTVVISVSLIQPVILHAASGLVGKCGWLHNPSFWLHQQKHYASENWTIPLYYFSTLLPMRWFLLIVL